MTMLISPSLVDSIEYWQGMEATADPEADEQRYQELRSQIRGEPWEPTPAMLTGRRFHQAVECPPAPCSEDGIDWYEVDGERFGRLDVDHLRDQIPGFHVPEAPGYLGLPEIGVGMYLRADAVAGLEVHEVKTTSRIDTDRYMASIQWRCYLLAFRARRVVYHLCRLTQDRKTGIWSVGDYLPLVLWSYTTLRADAIDRVRAARDFVVAEGLAHYREQKEERYAL